MASISQRKSGLYFLRFTDSRGKRYTLALGTKVERQALAVKLRIESLVSSQLNGQPIDPETATWLANSVSKKLRRRLELCKLVAAESPDNGPITLGQFLDQYFKARTDVKPSTRTNWQHAKRNLLAFFGSSRPLASITAGDAADFERYLRGKARVNRYADAEKKSPLSHATRRKRMANAKLFFTDAVDRKLIDQNPFSKFKSAVRENRTRDYFVTRDEAEKILEACPDAEWRLLFALSRYGGLRCPSEHVGLRWADVDWGSRRMLVRSPKTEHHEGKAERLVPLFAELLPHLEAAWEQAADGAEFVVSRYRDPGKNLRTMLNKVIRRAGLKPWPKLWQNLRASRATELAAEFPAHVAAAWMGHSTVIAARHYLQVTDEHFEQAALHKSARKSSQEVANLGHAGESTAGIRTTSQPIVFPLGGKGLEPLTPSV